MANKEQLEILKQGVKVWNQWKEENPDVTPDLSGMNLSGTDLREVDLFRADLFRANLHETNLRGANLRNAYLLGANLFGANLREVSLRGANLREADLREAILYEASLRGADLSEASLRGANLFRADLSEAYLNKADLSEANLSEANLVQTKLNHATLTGTYLYGTARDDWVIVGVNCDFVCWDNKPFFQKGNEEQEKQWKQKHRIPKDRNFRLGEFEELYKQLPTFEYYFEQGFTPLDPLIMNQVIQTINERRPEIDLTLKNFEVTGTPHATFTVLHRDNVEEALKEVTADYETRLKVLEGQKEQLMQVIAMLGSGNVMLQPVNDGINLRHTLSPELTQHVIEFLISLPGLAAERN